MLDHKTVIIMKKICNKWICLTVAVVAFIVTSCSNEEWDRHYNNTDYTLSDLSLSEYIKGQSDMSKFYQMLEISGYDTILNEPQTFTVWVPTNDALKDVDISDKNSVTELVSNHIARFSFPASGTKFNRIYMMSKKLVNLTNVDGQFFFGKNLLTLSNIKTKNGIIHKISTFQKYAPNIWEALDRLQSIDSLRVYLNSLTEVDDYGNVSNIYLDELGDVDLEDSIYTVIYPSNKAWKNAVARCGSYFVTRDIDGGQKIQDYYSKISVIANTVFRGLVDPFTSDSLISTNRTIFYNPGRLFTGATPIEASNGMIYLTDSIRFSNAELCNDTIKVEAEWSSYGKTKTNANFYERSTEGTAFKASNNFYTTIDPTSNSDLSKVSATFPIPTTRSTKYNIYCVFIPEVIADKNSQKPYVVNFYLDYIDDAGKVVKNKKIASNIATEPDKITKVFVGTTTNKFFDYYDGTNASIDVKLKVENAVKATETKTKSRTMRIDCIIFEPVE